MRRTGPIAVALLVVGLAAVCAGLFAFILGHHDASITDREIFSHGFLIALLIILWLSI